MKARVRPASTTNAPVGPTPGPGLLSGSALVAAGSGPHPRVPFGEFLKAINIGNHCRPALLLLPTGHSHARHSLARLSLEPTRATSHT